MGGYKDQTHLNFPSELEKYKAMASFYKQAYEYQKEQKGFGPALRRMLTWA